MGISINLFFFFFFFFFTSVHAVTFEIQNSCNYTIWAAAIPGGGRKLTAGETWVIDNFGVQSGRIRGRANCSYNENGQGKCEAPDCDGILQCKSFGPVPITIADFRLNQFDNLDFYDISLVEGFNIPMALDLIDDNCKRIICAGNVPFRCPEVLRSPGGCYDPCSVFKKNKYCCVSGDCGPTNYSRVFKNWCPNAISYPKDDANSTFTCPSSSYYRVEFCANLGESFTVRSNRGWSNMTASITVRSNATQSSTRWSSTTWSSTTWSSTPHSNKTRSNIPHSNKTRSNVPHSNKTRSNVPHSNTTRSNVPHSNTRRSNMVKKITIVSSIVVVAVILLFFIILFCCSRRKFSPLNPIVLWKKKSNNTKHLEDFLKNYASMTPKRYNYLDIKKMTNSFKDKLGQGGYGGVYKGKLQDDRFVAVKVLSESKGNGEDFINEVASIGRTSHVNIVNLLGFCSDGPNRALIYEFLPNGSLEKFIYNERNLRGQPQLGWERLHQIAIGIARGLEYLHYGCNTRILHFDIKPHNILLDEDLCPKISDFGLAKLCLKKESIISMADARGTIGYIAPEVFYKSFGGVSHKSDVYSYGMMVLEMVGGRKNLDTNANTSQMYFPHWIYTRLEQELNLGLQVTNEEEEEIARKLILVGLWCIQTHPSNRPSISKVLEMLEGNIESLKIPPKPFFSSPPRSPGSSTTSIS